jgi:hypothetical protein
MLSNHTRQKKKKEDNAIMRDLKQNGGCWLRCDAFSIKGTVDPASGRPQRICTCDH